MIPGVGPDFDNDGDVDIDDIDTLVGEIAAGENDLVFDLSADGAVDGADLDQWLDEAATINGFAARYLYGDSDLSGEVNASDLNNLALSGRGSADGWSGGDFKPDGVVDAGDLNELALNWRQAIPTAAAASVPEPSTLLPAIFGIALVWRRARYA